MIGNLLLMGVVTLAVIIGCRDKSPKTVEVEVEISDPMTVEKIRNLYEEQDTYNAKVSLLTRQNAQYEKDIEQINKRIQSNLDDVRIQLMVQPNANVDMLNKNCERANQDLYRNKLKLEGMVLTNSEKIVSYKKKSNTISEQITKIGMVAYKQGR